jgi:hypothetical protein
LEFSQDNPILDNRVSWSNSTEAIAFTQSLNRERIVLSIVDVITGELTHYDLEVPSQSEVSGGSTRATLHHDSWSLNDTWIQVTLTEYSPDNRSGVESDRFVNRESGEWNGLPDGFDFVSWSNIVEEEYLYVYHPKHPEIGNESICVGRVGSVEPKSCVETGVYYGVREFKVSWSPVRQIALFASYDPANGKSSVILIDLEKEESRPLAFSPNGDVTPLVWSPDGEWLLFWQGAIRFWRFEAETQPEAPLNAVGPVVTPLTWLFDTSWLVYQDENEIYISNPESPEDRELVFDLSRYLDLEDRHVPISARDSILTE